jgi:guanylate kinase
MLMIVAPSGAGKSSLVNALLESDHRLQLSLSCTTRAPRAGELDGRDYSFITKEDFLAKQAAGDFLESAQVHGNLYGTSRSWIEGQMQQGHDVILEIDWQGAQQIRKLIPQAIWVFIFPPSIEALEERLHKRGQDDEVTMQSVLQLPTSSYNTPTKLISLSLTRSLQTPCATCRRLWLLAACGQGP